jgi:HK97 family phage prohead protease
MKPSPPSDGVIKSLGLLVSRDAGSATAAPPRFRITSEVLDRHDDRVKLAGLDVSSYLNNPVVLWNHDDGEPAIGTARVFEEGGEWFMEPTFDEVCSLSKTVAAKVAAGTLRTCSIRFRVRAFSFNEEGGLDFEEVELLEVSITNIPANPEAVRVKNQAKQKTKTEASQSAVEETAAKALEQADLDAIKAALAELLQPLHEKLDALAAASSKAEGGEKEKDASEDEQAKDEEGMDVSDEEAEELKTFLNAALKKK